MTDSTDQSPPSVTVRYSSSCACGWTTRRYETPGNRLVFAKIRHDLLRHPLIALHLRKPSQNASCPSGDTDCTVDCGRCKGGTR